MEFQTFGKEKAPTLLLIPGLGVSYEIFLPLVRLMEEQFPIVAVEVDGQCDKWCVDKLEPEVATDDIADPLLCAAGHPEKICN